MFLNDQTPDLQFLVKKIAHRMSCPARIKQIFLEEKNLNLPPTISKPTWSDLCLSSGYPGTILLFTELDRQYPSEGWDRIVHGYALEIKSSLEKVTENWQGSMFGGLAGICFSLQSASRNNSRYQKMIDKLNILLVQVIQNGYLKHLKRNLREKTSSPPLLYDTITGLSGICLYFLQNIEKENFESLVKEMLGLMLKLTLPITVQGKAVPGWYVSGQQQFTKNKKSLFPNGNFNLGLSHGVTGLLAILALAWIKGVRLQGQKESIERISNWIIEKRFQMKGRCFWGSIVTFEEETQVLPLKENQAREAWCYGTPGIARTLLLASKALANNAWKKIAIEAFLDIFKRSPHEWNIPSPTFCHGLSGLSLITFYILKEVSGKKRVLLNREYEKLNTMILSQFDVNLPFGFQDICKGTNGKLWKMNKPSLLEGATGVLLTLLMPFLDAPKWDAVFLTNELGN